MKTQPIYPTTENSAFQPLPISNSWFDEFLPKSNSIYFDLDLSQCQSYNHLLNQKVLVSYVSRLFMGELHTLLDVNEPINAASIYTMLHHLIGQEQSGEMCIVGLDFKMSKSTKIQKIFLRITPTVVKMSNLFYDIVAIDISHLFKANFYWICQPISATKKEYFQTQFQKNYNYSIISDREKEVLKIVSLGFSSEQIANKLFISTITVNNHKQKMLKHTGTCDIVALLQICKLCKIID